MPSNQAGYLAMASPRRLAAILAADVVGYSRLTGEDEEGTLAALKTLWRDLSDPKIKEHHGRIVKTTGDGLLVEFGSVVDAVRCAVEVQREMAVRNTGIPVERRIEFRMGSTWATSSRTRATSTATASMSQHGSKPLRSPAGSASAG
jgi:class 3 adenylate cyclase